MITSPAPNRRRPRPRVARYLTLPIAAVLMLAACSSNEPASEPPPATRDVSDVTTSTVTTDGPTPSDAPAASVGSTTTTMPPPLDYEIGWEPLDDRVDGGWLTVPLDYADPQGETLDLWVVRHRADDDDRIGALLSNNGGPGVAASVVALNASAFFENEIVERFDVVSWDPRGTGRSDGAVDCIDDDEYDRFYLTVDPTPEDAAERQALVDLAQEYVERCIERVGDPLQYVGTNNSARDLDAIRQALGETQVSYFGFSYGSELGATWATLFPQTVRAAVLDGATDPEADLIEVVAAQWMGFEATLNTFLAECSSTSSCAFHNDGEAEEAFDTLFAAIDRESLPSTEGRPPVNLEVAINGVVQAMFDEVYWPALERALEDAAAGDGAGLLALNDLYFRRGQDGSYSNLFEALDAIVCADEPDRPDEAEERAEELIGVAPRLFPYTAVVNECTFFPEALDPRLPITGVGAGPIVVIGTTGDPSTTLESSRRMAEALEDGRLVILEANRHTGYLVSDCVQDIVHEYLIQLEAPASETVCA